MMSAWGKQIGLGIALVFSVALVTLLFSFLGTIACAALVGMMAGATRQWRWQIVLVSLVFPAVIAGFMHFTKTNLTSQQNLVLPLVCFGAFWLTYLLTCALGHFERRESSSAEAASQPAIGTETPQPALVANPGSAGGVISNPPAVRAEAFCEAGLAELQGMWSRDAAVVNGRACKKVIAVARDKLALSIVGADGQAQVVCAGNLKLERLGPFKILTIVGARTCPAVLPTERSGAPATWVYRITGQRLVVASNLEASADGLESAIEIYNRLPDPS